MFSTFILIRISIIFTIVKFRNKINQWWQVAKSRMTRNIGIGSINRISGSKNIRINRILICRPNHRLGNQLLMTPLLQEVVETFPYSKIDLLVKGRLGPILFANYNNVEEIIQLPARPFSDIFKYLRGWIKIKINRYDMVINVVHHSSSGRLATKFANAAYKWFGDTNENVKSTHGDYVHAAKEPVYSFRNFLTMLGFAESERPVPPLDLRLSAAEIEKGKVILNDLVKNDKKTIGIFTFATGAKCYDKDWWEEFYTRLKNEFPEFNIIEILPVENVSQISFKAPSFYSKDIRQIGSFMANTEIFIGADSGMMHLAVASQTPTVGLFKVTDAKTFGPYGNQGFAIDTNIVSMDESIKMIANVLLTHSTHP